MSLNGVFRGLNEELKKDIEERSSGGTGAHFGWFRLPKHGDEAQVRFLVTDENDKNMIAVYEHNLNRKKPPFSITCIGRDNGCPFCEAGERASLRVYFLLWNYNATPDKDGTTRHIQVWKRGTMDIQNILGLKEEYGELNNRDYKIRRNGSTMQNTSYQFFARDKSEFSEAEGLTEQLEPVVQAVLKMVEPKTVKEMTDFLNGVDVTKEETKPVEPPKDFNAEFPF